MPADGKEVQEIMASDKLHAFTDSYVDTIVRQATTDPDDVISSLALSIHSRNPPEVLKEVCVFGDKQDDSHRGLFFRGRCFREIPEIAEKRGIPLGRFLFYEMPPITLEKHVSRLTPGEYEKASTEQVKQSIREENDIVRIFVDGSDSPKSLLEIDYSIMKRLAGHVFRAYRLYFVPSTADQTSPVAELKDLVRDWDKP